MRCFLAPGPVHKGTVCLVQGRTEFIEKYFETIADFQKRGFQVATFDFRGQGGSDRLIRNGRFGFVERFDDYRTDLTSFHAEILLPDCPPPFYLVGHSMGGLVSLIAGAHDRPDVRPDFPSAPMIALDRQPLNSPAWRGWRRRCAFLGLGKLPATRASKEGPSEASFAGNPLTSDLTRFVRSAEVLKARPSLGRQRADDPVVGGGAQEAMAAAASRAAFPIRSRRPVLMLAAARRSGRRAQATGALGLRMRAGRHIIDSGRRGTEFVHAKADRSASRCSRRPSTAFVTNQT